MAHTSCPNGHDMWNGDGKSVVLAVRKGFVEEFSKKKTNIKIRDDDDSMYLNIFDIAYGTIGEDLECWYCEKCKGLKVYCDISLYLFQYYDKLPDVKYDDIKDWEDYVAIRFDDLEDNQEISMGKTPIEALEAYNFKFKYKVSKDKKIIYAIDSNNNIDHGWYRSLYFETSPDFNYSYGGSKPEYPYGKYKGKLDVNPQVGWYAYGHDKAIQIDKIVKFKEEYIGHYYNDPSCKPVVLKHSEILVVTDVLDEGEAKFYMQNVVNNC